MLDARESSAEYAEDRIERTAGLCGYCHYCCAYCGRQAYPDGENEVDPWVAADIYCMASRLTA